MITLTIEREIMNTMCPISEHRVNESVARMNALLVSVSLIAYLLTSGVGFLLFLLADFFMRAFLKDAPSPVSFVSKFGVKAIQIQPKWIDAAPKLFAAKIGFLFTFLITTFHLLGYGLTTVSLTSVMLTFAVLEAAFAICIACKVYTIACSMGLISEN